MDEGAIALRGGNDGGDGRQGARAGTGRRRVQGLAAGIAISGRFTPEDKEYEQADFPINNNGDTKYLEGEYHSWGYGTREGVSEIQVFRNFQTALKNGGFTIDYANSPEQLLAHKGATWTFIDNRGTYYNQTIITMKEMQQEVTADASSLAGEIEKSGHVAVYGINFDIGKSAILPSSENVLNEIAKLLKQNANLKLRVEGHTDNQGNAAVNQALSERWWLG